MITANIPASILIVDDIDANRNVLQSLIEALNHAALTADNGLSALAQIEKQPPDLILLDILMPEMDGYEVLQHLKSNPDLRHIPVIVISAVDEMESVIRCIEKGADDYLIKPFNRTLLKARIHSALDKKRLRDKEEAYRREIADYNLKLEAKVQEKTRELEAAYSRLRVLDKAKGDFLKLISREFNKPLQGLLGPAELLFRGGLRPEAQDNLKTAFRQAADRLQEFVEHAKLLTQIELADEKTLWLKPAPLRSILVQAMERAEADEKSLTLGEISKAPIFVMCNMEWLTIALAGLLKTALKLADSHSTINVELKETEAQVSLSILAEGGEIPKKNLADFFSLFPALESQKHLEAGDLPPLEPAIAERIIVLSGGTVSVSNQSEGVMFKVRLKATSQPLVHTE